jgi:hypothetical protein
MTLKKQNKKKKTHTHIQKLNINPKLKIFSSLDMFFTQFQGEKQQSKTLYQMEPIDIKIDYFDGQN